jgi:hypothetical protein
MNDKLETTYGRAFKDLLHSVETHKKNRICFYLKSPLNSQVATSKTKYE